MKSIKWMDLAQLIGIAGILATLVILVLEQRTVKDISQAQQFMNTYQTTIDFNSLIMEHADVFAKGNAGEQLSPDEQVIYYHLIRMRDEQAYWLRYSMLQMEWLNTPTYYYKTDLAAFLTENPPAYQVWKDYYEELSSYRALGRQIEEPSAWFGGIEEYRSLFLQSQDRVE